MPSAMPIGIIQQPINVFLAFLVEIAIKLRPLSMADGGLIQYWSVLAGGNVSRECFMYNTYHSLIVYVIVERFNVILDTDG